MKTKSFISAVEIGEAYLDAWNRKDISAIAGLIHPDAHFKGPMRDTTGRDNIIASVEGMFRIFKSITVRARFAAGMPLGKKSVGLGWHATRPSLNFSLPMSK
jgi:ketosteroid isomerase-like protein